MTEVQLSPNDRDDILELLDYALQKKLEEPRGKQPFNMGGYWLLRIPQLKDLVKGKKIYDSIKQSSMGGLARDIEDVYNETDY